MVDQPDELRSRLREAKDDLDALRRAVDALDGRVADLEADLSKGAAVDGAQTGAADVWSALAEAAREPARPPDAETVRQRSGEELVAAEPPEPAPECVAEEPVEKVRPGFGRMAELVEEHLGTKWFNWVGILAIIFAAAYFLKYSFDQGWITPAMRFYGGLAAGALLLGCGQFAQRRRYPTLARGFWGGGIALLFLIFFAGFKLLTDGPGGDPIIGREIAFLGMVATAAVGALLSIVHRSRAVAVLAALGGYLTPILLSTGQADQLFLFTYLAILSTGFLVIGLWMRWPFMPRLCWSASAIYFVAWWMAEYPGNPALTILFACVFFVLFTAETVVNCPALRRDTRPLRTIRSAATALLFAGGMLYLLNDLYPAWQGPFALVVAAVYLALAIVTGRRQPSSRGLPALYGHAAAVLLLLCPVVATQVTTWGITMTWLGTGVVVLVAGRLADNGQARFWALAALVLALARLCAIDTPELIPTYREGCLLFARPGLLYAVAAAALWAAWAAFRVRPLLGARSRPFGEEVDSNEFWPHAERIADSLVLLAAAALPLGLVWLGVDDLFRHFVAPRLGRMSAAYAQNRGLGLTFAFAAYATLMATISRRRREPVLVWFGVALAGATTVKMLMADLGIGYMAARTPLLNARFATVAFVSACAFWLCREAGRDDESTLSLRPAVSAFLVVGHLLALAALSMEWVDFAAAHADQSPGSAAVGASALGVAALLAIYGTVLQGFGAQAGSRRTPATLGGLLLTTGTAVWIVRSLVLRAPAPHPLAHFRFLSGAVIAGALFAAGRIWLSRPEEEEDSPARHFLSAAPLLAANALMIVILTLEAHDLFVLRGRSLALPKWLDPVDARRLSFSVIWTLYAIGMVVAGFIRSFRPVRVMALIILLATTLKVFVFDLAFLTGMYRVLSFLTLGLILVGVAYAYQRHRQTLFGEPDGEAAPVPESSSEG
jgi:uncharacterized membrane protein